MPREHILAAVTDEQFPQDPNVFPEASQATTILVLGILGIVVCGPLAIFAWVMGNNELAAIDAGRRPPENRGTANAGRILGIIGTVLLALGILFLIGIFAFGWFAITVDQLN